MNTKTFARARWSDNDRYWWRFTYSKAEAHGYRSLAVILSAKESDATDRDECQLRISALGRTLILALPAVIRPHRTKVVAHWDAATVARLGRDWYWHSTPREYGFTYGEGHLSIPYGRQTHASDTEQRWGTLLPWTQWRHVRRSCYDLNGEHFWTEPPRTKFDDGSFQAAMAMAESCPSVTFAFVDFDGEKLTAKTRIEEREWRFGAGSFRWLSFFRRPKIHRSLDIRFSGETGKRKGSWKGGTIGHSIEMLPGELHTTAFRRYCAAHQMTYSLRLAEIPQEDRPGG